MLNIPIISNWDVCPRAKQATFEKIPVCMFNAWKKELERLASSMFDLYTKKWVFIFSIFYTGGMCQSMAIHWCVQKYFKWQQDDEYL